MKTNFHGSISRADGTLLHDLGVIRSELTDEILPTTTDRYVDIVGNRYVKHDWSEICAQYNGCSFTIIAVHDDGTLRIQFDDDLLIIDDMWPGMDDKWLESPIEWRA